MDGYLLNNFYLKKIRRIFSVCFDNSDEHIIGETVKDDLAFSLENLQYSKEEIEALITNISKKFKLEDILEKTPNELNNSEKEKLAIASSLIHNPKILLFYQKKGYLQDCVLLELLLNYFLFDIPLIF